MSDYLYTDGTVQPPSNLTETERAQAAMREGAVVPFPGPAAAALRPPTRTVLGRPLVPITLGHLLVLQEIGSPLARVNGDTTAVTMAETIEAIFVCTHTPAALREVLVIGREDFREEAMRTIADNAGLAEDWPGIIATLGEHFAACAAPAVGYASPQADGGRSFPQPQPTGSAGACGSSGITPGSSGVARPK